MKSKKTFLSNFFPTSLWIKKLLANTGWMGFAQVVRVIENLIRSIVLARFLGLETFGAYATAMAFVSLISEIVNLNLGTIILTFGTRYRMNSETLKLKALIKLSYIASVMVIIASGMFSLFVLWLVHNTIFNVSGLFLIVSLLAFAASFNLIDQTNKGILRLFDKFKLSCVIDVILSFINITFTIGILTLVSSDLHHAIYTSIFGLLAVGTVSSAVVFFVLSKKLPDLWWSPIIVLRKDTSILLKTTFSNSVSLTLQRISRKIDILILAALAPGSSVGLYDVGKKVSAMILLPRDAIALAAFPQISDALSAGKHARVYFLLNRFLLFAVPFVILSALCIWLASEYLINLLFGELFLPASTILTILSITSLLYLVFFWSGAVLLQLSLLREQMLSTLICLIIIVSLAYLLGSWYQGLGVAWSMVIGTFFQFLIVYLTTLRKLSSYR